jgi:hypothetical protein
LVGAVYNSDENLAKCGTVTNTSTACSYCRFNIMLLLENWGGLSDTPMFLLPVCQTLKTQGTRPSTLCTAFSTCSFGLSATSHQYFSLRINQPPAISQQYFSLRTNQHQPSATSQTNMLFIPSRSREVVKYTSWTCQAMTRNHNSSTSI